MKFRSKISARVAWLPVALCALVSVASASEIALHVPLAARWGHKVLPAGDYKIEVTASSPFARVSGNGINTNVFVTSVTPQRKGDHGFLKIVTLDGTPTVAAFGSGVEGVTYYFATPKQHDHPRRPEATATATAL